MGNPSAAHEPSMEEILASIRQIISDDGEQAEGEAESSQGGDAPAATEAAEMGDTEPDMSAAAPEPAGEAAEDAAPPQDDVAASIAAAAPAREPAMPQQPWPEPTLKRQPADSLADQASQPSQSATQQQPQAAGRPPRAGNGMAAAGLPASAAMGDGESRLLSSQADASVSGAFSALAHTILAQNARTLEDLVSEMLRPMLKEWLDDNLPPLVERLVKEEIERVSRGRH